MTSRRDFLLASAALAAGASAQAADKPAWPDNPFLRGNFAPVVSSTTAQPG